MAFIKVAKTKTHKKPSLVSRITNADSGISNKVMIKTDAVAKQTVGGDQTISEHKISEISYSFNAGDNNGQNGDASAVVFSWCSDAVGSNPIAFFVGGGFMNGSKQIKFPIPLESPYATSNISVHGIGTEVCAGKSCSAKATYTAQTELKMTT